MKQIGYISMFLVFLFQISCEKEKEKTDYSGAYCLNLQNIEMIIVQKGNELTFKVFSDPIPKAMKRIRGTYGDQGRMQQL